MTKNTDKLAAAGCNACGGGLWILQLDQEPPNHTKFIKFLCGSCGAYVDVDILLEDARPKNRTRVPERCPFCSNFNTTRFEWDGETLMNPVIEQWICWDCDKVFLI